MRACCGGTELAISVKSPEFTKANSGFCWKTSCELSSSQYQLGNLVGIFMSLCMFSSPSLQLAYEMLKESSNMPGMFTKIWQNALYTRTSQFVLFKNDFRNITDSLKI